MADNSNNMFLTIAEFLYSEVGDLNILFIISFFLNKRYLSVKFLPVFQNITCRFDKFMLLNIKITYGYCILLLLALKMFQSFEI